MALPLAVTILGAWASWTAAARSDGTALQRWIDTVLPFVAAGIPAAIGLLALGFLVRRSQAALALANARLEARVAERTAALEASEARNAEILASIGEPLFALDAEGRVSYASASAMAFWGLARDALIGRPFDDVFPGSVGSMSWQAKQEVMRSRQPLHLCALSAFNRRWVEIDLYPLSDGGIAVAFRDIHARRATELERHRAETALRSSENWLRLAQEAGGIGAWATDPATGLRRWTEGTYRLWGIAPGTPVTLDLIMRLVHPDDRDALLRTLERGRDSAGPLPALEFRIRRASDGAERVLAFQGIAIAGAGGRTRSHIGVTQDVTEQRAAQAALRAGEARLKAAVAGARFGVWERHLPSRSGHWDARATEIYGGLAPERCSPDLAEWRERVHPADQAGRLAAIAAAVAPGGPDSYACEFRFRRDDGGWNWVGVHGTVVERDPVTGAGVRLAGVSQDLTERRNAEEALRLSEERLRLTQEAGHVGSWDWDIATGALHWSASCHRLHGTDPAVPITYDAWLACIHPEDRGRIESEIARVLQDGSTEWEIELRIIRPVDGVPRRIVGRGRVARDPATGAALGMLGVTLDVTERRAAEERLLLLAREVDHRAKNALAVVQAAIRLAPKDDAVAFARAVEGRVTALARAQVLLADGGWAGTDLRVLAEGALAAFLPPGLERSPARLDGPPVQLAAAATQPISLALHELATNAAKYGALSAPGGAVRLCWRIDAAARLLRVTWRENGGPAVTPPQRRGFGSRVIEGTIGDQLGGSLERVWDAAGLRCEIALPLARALARPEESAPA